MKISHAIVETIAPELAIHRRFHLEFAYYPCYPLLYFCAVSRIFYRSAGGSSIIIASIEEEKDSHYTEGPPKAGKCIHGFMVEFLLF
jgi:hypothetical protein